MFAKIKSGSNRSTRWITENSQRLVFAEKSRNFLRLSKYKSCGIKERRTWAWEYDHCPLRAGRWDNRYRLSHVKHLAALFTVRGRIRHQTATQLGIGGRQHSGDAADLLCALLRKARRALGYDAICLFPSERIRVLEKDLWRHYRSISKKCVR